MHIEEVTGDIFFQTFSYNNKMITMLWFMEKKFFDQPLKNNLRTYGGIRKITTGQCDDYTTGCLLHYLYFQTHYKVIAIDLSKQQLLDADPKTMQQINFTGNLDQAGNTTIFIIIQEAKETILEGRKNCESFINLF